ncbi:hypothetical protein GGX14DRAFT_593428 [Mycena pura]|uniref:Uncharacterized protein n=1 Tax=Mycena pura TaxID=153505 RepID=A0AAD6URJ0_9AGAR|nr:hypothetical protein GGX14DRAFT_593428 [Mycena pura]
MADVKVAAANRSSALEWALYPHARACRSPLAACCPLSAAFRRSQQFTPASGSSLPVSFAGACCPLPAACAPAAHYPSTPLAAAHARHRRSAAAALAHVAPGFGVSPPHTHTSRRAALAPATSALRSRPPPAALHPPRRLLPVARLLHTYRRLTSVARQLTPLPQPPAVSRSPAADHVRRRLLVSARPTAAPAPGPAGRRMRPLHPTHLTRPVPSHGPQLAARLVFRWSFTAGVPHALAAPAASLWLHAVPPPPRPRPCPHRALPPAHRTCIAPRATHARHLPFVALCLSPLHISHGRLHAHASRRVLLMPVTCRSPLAASRRLHSMFPAIRRALPTHATAECFPLVPRAHVRVPRTERRTLAAPSSKRLGRSRRRRLPPPACFGQTHRTAASETVMIPLLVVCLAITISSRTECTIAGSIGRSLSA